MTPPDAKLSAQERWQQRILGGLDVRPVGHAEPPAEDEAPATTIEPAEPPKAPDETAQVPAPAPVVARTATAPQTAGQTIPPWWDTRPRPEVGPDTGKAPDAPAAEKAVADPAVAGTTKWVGGVPRDVPPPVPPKPTEPPKNETAPADQADEAAKTDQAKATPSGPTPGAPVEKTTKDAKRRARPKSATRKRVEAVTEAVAGDRRLHILAFNGTAAGIGYSFGLVDVVRAYLPVAEHAALGTFGGVLAVGAGWAAWKVAGTGAVQTILPAPLISRVVLTVCAAELGRRFAPLPVDYLNRYGQEWGLGPDQISLLITAGGICGGLWWLADRRVRHWHWTARWLVRIPLASALLACLPYDSTPVA